MEPTTNKPLVVLTRDEAFSRARVMARSGAYYDLAHILRELTAQGFTGGTDVPKEPEVRPPTPEETEIEDLCIPFRGSFFFGEIEDRLEDLNPPDRFKLDGAGGAFVETFDEIEIEASTQWPGQWNPLAEPDWRKRLEALALSLGCTLKFEGASKCVFRRIA